MSKESGGPYNRKYRVILTEQTWFITWQIGYAKNRNKNEFFESKYSLLLKQFFSMYTVYKDYAGCIPAHMQPTMILMKLIDDEEM